MMLVHERRGRRGAVVRLRLEQEPEDALLWLIWYLGRLHALEPAAKWAFTREGRPPQTFLLIDPSDESSPQPQNKRGEPINLAGPALVKVYDVLTGLPNNQIQASARSNSKLGLSFGVDRAVIKRWREHPEWEELEVDVVLDGEGGVYFTVDFENHLRSVRIVSGKKRGPSSEHPSKEFS
jgi:hypothetical protein